MTSQATTHYNLGKFITTDIPSWLSDVNGNMDKLDTALYNLAQLQQTLQGDLDTAIGELETAQGNISSLEEHSAVQDSSITSLQASVTNLTNSITAINTSITTLNSFKTLTTGSVTYIANVTETFKNIKKVSGVITVSLVLSFNVGVSANTPIFTLPVGFRPTGSEIVMGNQLNGAVDYYYDVSSTNGNVSASINIPTGAQIRFNAVFI